MAAVSVKRSISPPKQTDSAIHHFRNEKGTKMCPTRVSGIVTGAHQSGYGQSLYVTLVTDPEVFANVNSAQFPAGF